MSIQLLTFDLDDTLWPCQVTILKAEKIVHQWLQDNYPEISNTYNKEQLFEKRSQIKDDNPHLSHDISAIRHLSLYQLAQEFEFSEAKTKQFVKKAFEVYINARNQVTLYDDVLPVLNKLKANYRLVAVSNGNANIYHTNTGLDNYFEFSWSAAQAGKEKPHAKIFLDVMQKSGVSAGQMLHIGDDPLTDIQGAYNANIRSIWINRNEQKWPKELKQAQYEVENLLQLPDIIDKF